MRIGTFAVIAVLLVAGCSSGDAGAETPKGYVRAAGSIVSVAHPSDWSTGPLTKTIKVNVLNPGKNAELQVREELSQAAGEDILVDIVEASLVLQVTDYARKSTKRISVPGAQAAVRVDYTYKNDQGVPATGVDIGILGKNDHVHSVRLNWSTSQLSDSVVKGIIDSVEVE